jgi:hypothetical protein
MPYMVNLARYPDGYPAIGRLLARKPGWESDFWDEFVKNPASLEYAAAFFANGTTSIDRLSDIQRTTLYENLRGSGNLAALYALADIVGRGSGTTDDPTARTFPTADDGDPVGWALHSSGNYSVSVNNSSGDLEIDARAGSFGLAANRPVLMATANTLAIRLSEPVPDGSRLEVAVVCPGADRSDSLRIVLAAGQETGGTAFSHPGCDYASLEIHFSAAAGRREVTFRIDEVSIAAT